jgi:hypothetical protein
MAPQYSENQHNVYEKYGLGSQSWPLVTAGPYFIGRLYSLTRFFFWLFSIEIRATKENIPITSNSFFYQIS